jgi:alpha/beta hydrolase fold
VTAVLHPVSMASRRARVMPNAHDCLARSDFPIARGAAKLRRVTSRRYTEDAAALRRVELGAVLVADLTLRLGRVRLHASVLWPRPTTLNAAPALIFLLEDANNPQRRPGADPFGESLCSATAAVVLCVPAASGRAEGPGRECEIDALGWAADHAAELGAHPQRLSVAGVHAAGARAACLAISARDSAWPPLRRQLLVDPKFSSASPIPSRPEGVVPATVFSSTTGDDDGKRYAALLRASGVQVEELHHRNTSEPSDKQLAGLARSVRRAERGRIASSDASSITISGDERRGSPRSNGQHPNRGR